VTGYDAKAIKAAASGRWREILQTAGLPAELLDGKGHACPRCGGSDRFAAHADVAERGAVICRRCFSEGGGDGFATLQWLRGWDFSAAVQFVAQHLGITPAGGGSGSGDGKPRIVARYDYRDERDSLILQVLRYEPGKDGRKKSFSQRRPDPERNGKWIWSTKGVRKVPYMLPQLLREPQKPVVVVEGEKDADNLARLGVLATTNAGGAGTWTAAHSQFLRGRRVVILPDADDKGRRHALQVAQSVQGIAASVRILELPGLPPNGDVSDWLAAGGTREKLRELARATPEWTPSPHGDSAATAATAEDGDQAHGEEEPPEFQPFPTEILPWPICDYIDGGGRALGCDASFIALPLLAALAAAVGNSRRIKLKESWSEPCVVWTVTIGPSGTLKSPAWELGVRPLQRRQDIAFQDYAEAMHQHERDSACYDADYGEWKKGGRKKGQPPPDRPEQPTAVRFLCSDCTVEALAVLLEENPRGILLARDELSGWLASFDAYKSARGADAPHWLSMHRAGVLTVDRKSGRRIIHVPRAAVSIAGCTQAEILQLSLGGRYEGEEGTREHFANGLAARLLLAYPPRRPKKWTDADLPGEIVQAVDQVFERLLELDLPQDQQGRLEPVCLPLTPEAQSRFIRFYDGHAEEQAHLNSDLAAAWSKLEGYAARFALLIHLVRDAAGDRTLRNPAAVDLESMEAGVTLSRWFADEAARIYAEIGGLGADTAETRQERERGRLAEWIRGKGGSVTIRDLQRGPRPYREAAAAEAALQALVDAGQGQWVTDSHGGGRGRPVRVFTLIGSGDGNSVFPVVTGGDGDTNSENPRETVIVSPSPVSPAAENENLSPRRRKQVSL